MMSPLRILIERKDQISALTTKCSENCKIAKILQTALNQKIINEKQMDQLTLLSRNISA